MQSLKATWTNTGMLTIFILCLYIMNPKRAEHEAHIKVRICKSIRGEPFWAYKAGNINILTFCSLIHVLCALVLLLSSYGSFTYALHYCTFILRKQRAVPQTLAGTSPIILIHAMNSAVSSEWGIILGIYFNTLMQLSLDYKMTEIVFIFYVTVNVDYF